MKYPLLHRTPIAFQLVFVFLGTAVVMAAYEWFKDWLTSGSLSLWQSHAITIVFASTLATVVSFTVRQWARQADSDLVRLIERELEREREFHTLADNIPDNIVRWDLNGRMLFANKTMENTLGRPLTELHGRTTTENYPGGEFDALDRIRHEVGLDGKSREIEIALIDPHGCPQTHAIRLVAEAGRDGRIGSVLAIGRDITRNKMLEDDLRLAASVFETSTEGVLVTDTDARILSVNPAFTKITGYEAADALGQKPSLLRSDRHAVEFYQHMWDALVEKGQWQGEIWNRRKSGEAYLEWMTINRILDDNGKPVRYVSIFHDITEQRSKDEHIRHLAFHDALTGLPNRMLFQERLHHAIERAKRQGERMSVTFVDLDGFKNVNDTLGHDVGDLLLQEVAQRIRLRLRRGADTVARLGGDEFVVLMEDFKETEHCASLAAEIIEDLSRPFSLKGHIARVGASMGMAFFPDDGITAHDLMKHADTAMYAAKLDGKGTYRFFKSTMLEAVSARLALENELRQAIHGEELFLHFQPKIEMADGRMSGVEALVRWQHPTRGIVSPAVFIPLAEETGLIHALGDWVLDRAFRQAAAWQENGLDLSIAINISALQITKGKLPERLGNLLEEYRINAGSIQLELTESVLMSDSEKAIKTLLELRRMGFIIAVDDFGTGYSSLSRLRQLPIDILKIDRSFVMQADKNEKDAQVVRMVVALARLLNLDIVAEGVESAEQIELLKSTGCTVCQGHYYAEAMPAEHIEKIVLQ